MTEKRPALARAFDATAAAFAAACEADPLIPEALARAAAATGGAGRIAHLGFAAERLAGRASLPAGDWFVLLAGKSRISTVPGVPGRTVWAIRDDADADALRAAIEPGQVWVRADLVRSDDWPTVRAVAADAVERTLGKVRPAGRRTGSPNRARVALLAAIRERPGMTAEAIDELATGLGYSEPALDDYECRERAKRLRKAARRINP